MATYAEIITAIDQAIADGVGSPVSVSRNGRTITYRGMDELIKARKYYKSLAAGSSGKRPFKIIPIKAGGAR